VATVTSVLTSFDDYPIHQASVPIANSASGDVNQYDRYFFNGYSSDGSLYFAAAMGLYPNRHVADAAFCVVRPTGEGDTREQASVFVSQRAPADRRDATRLGPIEVRVIEPLHVLRVLVDAPEQGIRTDLTFTRRSPVIEEPHFFQRTGNRTFMDYTRLTQFGSWQGWLEVDGERIEVDPVDVLGSRDRSWGIRPVGEPAAQGAPTGWPQFFWLWAPVNFPSCSTHFDVNEYADGRRWHEVGAFAPVGETEAVSSRTVEWRGEWRPGTRWAAWLEYDLVHWDGSVDTVRLEPMYEFHMRGIGYGNPEFGHGYWKGELVVGGERISSPVDTPCAREHVHVQAMCRATLTRADGSVEHGLGILEQLAFGDHVSGLRGILDPYAP
jgi:hypothetical protein